VLGYCTVSDVRDLTDITSSDISDTELSSLIDLATQMIIKDITIPVVGEKLSGSINGTNTTFSTSYYPIADINGDKTVDGSDVTVYLWTDSSDPSTKSTISVETIYPNEGKIVLSSAPSSSVEKITCDYSYTWHDSINWELVKVACVYLTAFLFYVKKYTAIPLSVARGPIRFRWDVKPYVSYLNQYYHVMSLVKSKKYSKKTASNITLLRGRM